MIGRGIDTLGSSQIIVRNPSNKSVSNVKIKRNAKHHGSSLLASSAPSLALHNINRAQEALFAPHDKVCH